MTYISDIQFFRDVNKDPELDPEKNRLEIDEEKKRDKKNKSEKRAENFTNPVVANYEHTIKLVENFCLRPGFSGQSQEDKIIESRKEAVLKLLRKILDDIDKYTSQINNLRRSRHSEYYDVKNYQDAVGRSDELRRSLHNKLISDLKLTLRLINVSFNADFPAEKRLLEEKKFTDRKGLSDKEIIEALAERSFVSFPQGQGAFIDWKNCPKNETGEREFIMQWAVSFYDDLTKLEKDLDEELKEKN